MAFNIYFERDPSVDPGTGNSGCANPSSVIYAKCALWGGPLNSANANNKGQMRNQFEVAVAGSNAYQNNSLTIPVGYSLKAAYNNVAINAPYDAQGFNTYMGATIFTKGPFNIQLCADYCSAQTKYNFANPASDGTPPKSCNFFNTYILYKGDASNPQGQYCSIYTEQWPDSYAVNSGQTRDSVRYFIGYSYTFANSTSASIAPKVGDKNGAIYQARQDMTYYPSQLTSTFQPFCSSVLGYTIPVASATALTTVTPVVSSTVYSTAIVTVANAKRAAATPDVLTKYPASVVASACSLIATSPTSTSTLTAATSTVTAAASTTVVTSVTTVSSSVSPSSTSFKLVVSAPGTTFDGALVDTQITPDDGTESSASDLIFLYQGSTTGAVFTMDLATGQVSTVLRGSKYTLLAAQWQNGVFPLAKLSDSDNVGTLTRGERTSCTFDPQQGLICGPNFFSLCTNDVNLHFANYERDSSCSQYALIPVGVN